jgi:hypothetical protein
MVTIPTLTAIRVDRAVVVYQPPGFDLIQFTRREWARRSRSRSTDYLRQMARLLDTEERSLQLEAGQLDISEKTRKILLKQSPDMLGDALDQARRR